MMASYIQALLMNSTKGVAIEREVLGAFMIDRFSIVTLFFFLLSAIFVIHPVSFVIRLNRFGHRRVRINLNLTTAPIIAIAILWVAQCLGATQIRNGIVGTDDIKPYNILILFITLAYMAITLDITGILQAAAYWVSNKGGSHTRRLFFYFYVMLTIISMLLGNDPVILSGTAFLVYYTTAVQLEPLPWLMSEFAAANTSSMVLFVGNPTNVVICEGFLVNNAAFTAYTILPFLACSVSCFFALFAQFRSEKHLPPKVPRTTKLDPHEVLRDPIGAWVGSFVLGSCLVVIIIVSFFKVDVWKISLPFACVKLIFDLAWDHYRFSTTEAHPEKHQPDNHLNESTDARDEGIVSHLHRIVSLDNGEAHHAPDNLQSASTDMTRNDTNTDGLLSFQMNTKKKWDVFANHFPTLATALPRLPFALIPFAFSQFILIEALSHQGWIEVFAGWLAKATHGGQMHPTIWLIGVLGVLLCNLAGTNIGATILLTKIVRAVPHFPKDSMRAAAIALAVASNIGAVSFVFSASLAGLLWHNILLQKGIDHIGQWRFAFWNLLPLATMTSFGLAVVSAEMAVLYRR